MASRGDAPVGGCARLGRGSTGEVLRRCRDREAAYVVDCGSKWSPDRRTRALAVYEIDANGDGWTSITVLDGEGETVAVTRFDSPPEPAAVAPIRRSLRWPDAAAVAITPWPEKFAPRESSLASGWCLASTGDPRRSADRRASGTSRGVLTARTYRRAPKATTAGRSEALSGSTRSTRSARSGQSGRVRQPSRLDARSRAARQNDAVPVRRRFRGSLVRSRVTRGGFWNTLTATADEIQLGSWPLCAVVIRRASTSVVRFHKLSLPFWWGTDVMFDGDGRGRRYVFRPFRPRELAHHLRSLGWPVVEADEVKVRTALQRLRLRRP